MIEPLKDGHRELPVPEKKAIGFADSGAEFQTITTALSRAGFPDSAITALYGPDGIDMLERLRGVAFFGDWERAVADEAIQELRDGHYALAIDVENREEAVRVAEIAKPHGGHGFNYFGRFVNEQLTQ